MPSRQHSLRCSRSHYAQWGVWEKGRGRVVHAQKKGGMLESGASLSFLRFYSLLTRSFNVTRFRRSPADCAVHTSCCICLFLFLHSLVLCAMCALNVAKSVTQLASRPLRAGFDAAHLSHSLSDRASLHTRHCFPLC